MITEELRALYARAAVNREPRSTSKSQHDPDKVILIGKNGDGKIVFLESGNAKAGLQHVMDHADQFTDIGVPRDKEAYSQAIL